jgi:phosphopantothenoylcysteine decarboxylase/phosphopantothenate--cysteine ligase
VTLVSGPTGLPIPVGVTRVDVESALEMKAATEAALPADIAVLSAAVADWRIDTIAGGKIKKGPGGPPTLALIENPDILAGVAAPGPLRPKLVIGFAAETTDLEANARAKLSRKGCDWIVGNDVSDDVFGSDGNTVLLVSREGTESWPRQPKTAIARQLAARIADHFMTDGKA